MWSLWCNILPDLALPLAKLMVTWVGPHQVVEPISDVSYKLRSLVTGKELVAHTSRMKYYADSSLEVTEEFVEYISQKGKLMNVETLESHRYNNVTGEYEIRVKWEGLEQIEDTWEPFDKLKEDEPILVEQYVQPSKDKKLQEELKHKNPRKKQQKKQ